MSTVTIAKMTLAEAKEYCEKKREEAKERNCYCEDICKFNNLNICGGFTPHTWIVDKHGLTDDELNICKALKAKWVSFGLDGIVGFWDGMPDKIDMEGNYRPIRNVKLLGTAVAERMPSMERGECIYVYDMYAQEDSNG